MPIRCDLTRLLDHAILRKLRQPEKKAHKNPYFSLRQIIHVVAMLHPPMTRITIPPSPPSTILPRIPHVHRGVPAGGLDKLELSILE
jgi:hypothetical protein